MKRFTVKNLEAKEAIIVTEIEFKVQMKKLGYSDEDIEELLELHEEDKRKGFPLPLEVYCIELPVD